MAMGRGRSGRTWRRTRPRRRRQEGRRQAGAAPWAVSPSQGLQVLRGQNRRHQLQGRQAPDRLRAGAGQGPAAAHLRHLREASARLADRDRSRASARAAAVRGGLRAGDAMEVILRDHVEHLGRRGEIVKVADGYARNYLLPRKLALPATDANQKMGRTGTEDGGGARLGRARRGRRRSPRG